MTDPQRHAGFFMRAGRWLAIGVLLGAGGVGGLVLAATLLHAACSGFRGGFGG